MDRHRINHQRFICFAYILDILFPIMGGVNSCFPSPIDKFNTLRRRHRYVPAPSRSSGSNRVINRNNNNSNKNAVNLNTASEDELLMLPGITRPLAQEILYYRLSKQGFQRIDELLQISGIHPDLLKKIRSDLSIDTCPQLCPEIVTKQDPINLNLATYDQLCSIPGLTPLLIERILQRRERKGPFQFVEDLLKIKGIDYIVLARLRPFVFIDSRPLVMSASESSIFQPSMNHLYPTLNRNTNNPTVDSLSLASLLLETLPPELQTILLSSPPQRPSSICIEKEKTFRFASWNLQQLTNEKVQNPGVREVICRIVLEHQLSLIGIQEIGHKEALGFIVEELNRPTIPSIKDWPNRRQGRWTYAVSEVSGRMFQGSEYLGFIYDESAGIECKKASLLPFKSHFTRSPFIGVFRLDEKYEFVFVNIHLKARRLDENENERTKDEALSLSILAEAMDDTVEQKHIVIFGDFNLIPTASAFEALSERDYSYVIRENTNISLKMPQGSTCMDNIWLSAPAKALTNDKSGVIRDNLSSMWIPAGWSWGGLVSDHCPIWLEFDLT